MNPATVELAIQLISLIPAVLETGSKVAALLNQVSAAVLVAQKNGTDPTPADWATLEQIRLSLKADIDKA